MKQGDYVTRKSYGNDLLFRIQEMVRDVVVLRGVNYRLMADAPASDLLPAGERSEIEEARGASLKIKKTVEFIYNDRIKQREKQISDLMNKPDEEHPFFEVPGTVLHLDGDPNYLRKSMTLYGQLQIPAVGHYVPEMLMAETLHRLLPRVKPEIVVITGHDGLIKKSPDVDRLRLDNYKNSGHFVQAVQTARSFERNRDALTIVAGACQSHFEALLQAGANFASSPGRVLIHALDPVYIAVKAAYTSIKETVNIYEVVGHTVSGLQGIGGIESRGSYRIGLPKVPNHP